MMQIKALTESTGAITIQVCNETGEPRRYLGTLYGVTDAEQLFLWKTRNDGLESELSDLRLAATHLVSALRAAREEGPPDCVDWLDDHAARELIELQDALLGMRQNEHK